MKSIDRILAVCNDFDTCDMLLAKTAQMARRHQAGVTVMFVHEHDLFELPVFTEEVAVDRQKIREEIAQKVRNAGIENAAIFVYESETADRVALESTREADTVIVTPYVEGITSDVIEKAKIPVLVLKEALHSYAKAVVAIDAVMPRRCLALMQHFFEGVELHLYQDFQYIPVPTVDPAVEPLDVGMDATIYTELLDAKREAFREFCKEKGLKGTFEVGESGIDEDTVSFVRKQNADLLVLAPLDRGTILGEAVGDILEKSETDIFVCYETK